MSSMMTRSVVTLLATLLTAFTALCTACVFPDGASRGLDFDGGDGGLADLECINADGGPDGGPDGGCQPPGEPRDLCSALVGLTCGETCLESPGCAAATLLRDHEPERCTDALDDTQTFPHCELSSCEALVIQACGANPPLAACVDEPGCAPAQALAARIADPQATQDEIAAVTADCVQALEDVVVFAPCP